MTQQIAIQGGAGSFSHMATLKIFPNAEIKFCVTFEEAFLLSTQKPELSLVCPCENTVAGRVPEFHSLLRRYSLQIYAEHFEKIRHNLLFDGHFWGHSLGGILVRYALARYDNRIIVTAAVLE